MVSWRHECITSSLTKFRFLNGFLQPKGDDDGFYAHSACGYPIQRLGTVACSAYEEGVVVYLYFTSEFGWYFPGDFLDDD